MPYEVEDSSYRLKKWSERRKRGFLVRFKIRQGVNELKKCREAL